MIHLRENRPAGSAAAKIRPGLKCGNGSVAHGRGYLAILLGRNVAGREYTGNIGFHVGIDANVAVVHVEFVFEHAGVRGLAYEAEYAVNVFGIGSVFGLVVEGDSAS